MHKSILIEDIISFSRYCDINNIKQQQAYSVLDAFLAKFTYMIDWLINPL